MAVPVSANPSSDFHEKVSIRSMNLNLTNEIEKKIIFCIANLADINIHQHVFVKVNLMGGNQICLILSLIQ